MAVPNIIVTLGGTNYPIPQVGSTPWGQNVTNWIVAASGANGFIQLGGGSQPLAADLNLGASFGLISIYYKSRSANIATAGVIRLANADTIDWRNFGNTADDKLFVGLSASSQSADDLYFTNGTTAVTTQLTGNPAAAYNTSAAVAWTVVGGTVTGFNTLIYDTDIAYVPGTGTFTVPANKGGFYYVLASMDAAAGAVTTAVVLQIKKNGANGFRSDYSCNATLAQAVVVSGIFQCNAGDTITIFQQSTVANAGFANAAGNFIIVKRIA